MIKLINVREGELGNDKNGGLMQCVGDLTYAQVDCYDDVWRWAIVEGYRGAQDYDAILMAFAPDYEPSAEEVRVILTALQPTG